MKNKPTVFVILLALVLGLPFLLRKDRTDQGAADVRLVVITPHTESIRKEFALGFEQWYREKTGKSVYLDYRVIGGTSEIAQYVESEYANAFRNYWTGKQGREWSLTVQESFMNPRIELDDTPENDNEAEAARRAFLGSEISSGLDVFFGGGAYDFSTQARKGTLVRSRLLETHGDWFQRSAERGQIPEAIPQYYAGEQYFDAAGRWFGAALSSYGIIFNRDVLKRLGIEEGLTQWEDLGDPRLMGQIAVCDPTKSGSMNQAFEMMVQQQIQQVLNAGGQDERAKKEGIEQGWMRGLQLIQRISANARYFTDTSQKPNIDVGMGDCAAGMSIDFYGRFQQEAVLSRSEGNRFGFVTPQGGSTVSCDPIGIFRGAPHRELAEVFLEYVLSLEGQKLWNYRVGTDGGPQVYALRRLPIRPELYGAPYNEMRSDLAVNPYLATSDFEYHREWTGHLFSELRVIVRICFMDTRKELVDAWKAIHRARAEGRQIDANRAFEVFSDLDRISYEEASTTIDAALNGPSIDEVRLARELSVHFRDQYNRAKSIANGALRK